LAASGVVYEFNVSTGSGLGGGVRFWMLKPGHEVVFRNHTMFSIGTLHMVAILCFPWLDCDFIDLKLSAFTQFRARSYPNSDKC
jgi:hypothetical protein